MRHGETDANMRDIICGRTDLPLNPAGIAQVRQAAAFLAGSNIARIVTSPLARARQTARAIADVLDIRPEVIPDLAERDWGRWEGSPRAGLRRGETPPDGEAPEEFRRRIRSALARITLGSPLLIVAHSGTDREIRTALTDAPHRRLSNAEIVLWKPSNRQWNCHECFKPLG